MVEARKLNVLELISYSQSIYENVITGPANGVVRSSSRVWTQGDYIVLTYGGVVLTLLHAGSH